MSKTDDLPPMTAAEAVAVKEALTQILLSGPIISLTAAERAEQLHADYEDEDGYFYCESCGEYAVQGRPVACKEDLQ